MSSTAPSAICSDAPAARRFRRRNRSRASAGGEPDRLGRPGRQEVQAPEPLSSFRGREAREGRRLVDLPEQVDELRVYRHYCTLAATGFEPLPFACSFVASSDDCGAAPLPFTLPLPFGCPATCGASPDCSRMPSSSQANSPPSTFWAAL